MKVGYVGGTPESDPYRRGFDFWVDFANNNTETNFPEGKNVFAIENFIYEFDYFSYFDGYFEGPHCGGIDAYPVIESRDQSTAEEQMDYWRSLGVHLVIIGMDWGAAVKYRETLSRRFINHFCVNVYDWWKFKHGATDWTWSVGTSHLDWGKSFATLAARESRRGICLLNPNRIGCSCEYEEILIEEAFLKAVAIARDLGLETVLEEQHNFNYAGTPWRTVNFLKGFAQRVVESGCDILMAFTRDAGGALLLQKELANVSAPLMAEFVLPEVSESAWRKVGTLGEHVYSATLWHPTANFECPVFGNTTNFVALYQEWEEQNYGVARLPGQEEAASVAAGVLTMVAQADPWFAYAEGVSHILEVPEEDLFSYRLRKVFEGIEVTTFYGDVHFDGRGLNSALTPVTIQYFENAVKYAVRPKGATIKAAALPMDSFESRDNPDESLPGCPPGTKLILRVDNGWTLSGKRCEQCEPLEYQDEYNQTECKTCPDGEVSGTGDSTCTPCSPGTFRAPGMSSCALCAEGQSANTSGATACESCGPGTVVSDNSTRCTPCPPGSYSGPLDTECFECNWGEFTGSPGATQCERCSAGRFASAEGQSRCEGCSEGHYAPEPGGQRECLPCPMGSSTEGGNESAECKACDEGFYSNETGSPTCMPCPDTFSTEQIGSDSEEKCVCPPGSYWHRETDDSEPTCQTRHCGTVLICAGWSNAPPTVAEGFSGGVQLFEGAEPLFLVKCGSTRQCPEGSELGQCPPGHKDERACAECKESHSKRRSGECVECDAMPTHVPILLLLAVVALVGVIMYGLRKQEIDVESESAIKVTAVAGILITSLQILAVFRYIAVDWPEPITTFHNGVALLLQPIELFNLDCIFSINASDSYSMVMLMWPAIMIFVILLFKISGCFCSSRGNRVSNNTIFQIECMLILVFYTSISMLSLLPWQCEDNPDLTASVVAYRQVICWDSGEHTGMVILSCIAVLIFVIGFLSLMAWATFLYPIQVTLPEGVNFLVRYRWIFHRFKPERYYQGLIYSTRNLLVALLPVIFANNMPLQFLLVGATLLVSLMGQCWMKPWKTEVANKFDAACTTLLVLMLVVGSLLLSPDEADVELIVKVFFSLSFALIGLAFIFMVVYHVHLRVTHKKRFAVFLCHHKVGAAVLARWVKIELKLRYKGWEVFLDSDELSRLDTLFETVGFHTQNFVVLLTKETLKRIWCAGEITTALRQNLNVICIACNDYEEPTDEFIESLATVWTDTQISEVARQGVSLPQIEDAFQQFRELPKITLDRNAAYKEQARLIEELGSKSTGTRHRRSQTEGWDSAWSYQPSPSEMNFHVPSEFQGGRPSNESSAVPLPVAVPVENPQNTADGPTTATNDHHSLDVQDGTWSGQLQGDDDEPRAWPLPWSEAQTPPMEGPSAEEMEQVVAEISATSIVVNRSTARSQANQYAKKKTALSRIAEAMHQVDSKGVVKAMKTRVLSDSGPAKDTNLMVGHFADPEAAMVCRVIQLQLQQVLQTGVRLCSREIPEALEQVRCQHSKCLVAVLTRGLLSRLEFAVVLAKACALSPRPTMVPIVADYAFAFPDSSFYADLESGSVLNQQELETHGVFLPEVEEAYKALFTVISKRFSSHGSEKIQLTEVQEMASLVSDVSHTHSAASHNHTNTSDLAPSSTPS